MEMERNVMAGGTRDLIIETTERLIKLKGLSRVTTREIAQATNLSEGALYRHFERKEDIFFALLSAHLPVFLDAFKTHLAGEGTVSENLVVIAGAAITFYDPMMALGAAFFADTSLLMQLREMVIPIGGGPLRVHHLLATYLEEEQQLGRINAGVAPLSIAIQMLGPIFQYVFFRQMLGSDPWDQTPEQFAESLIQTLLPLLLPSQ
jgi:AcrR family transcriptional regulator